MNYLLGLLSSVPAPVFGFGGVVLGGLITELVRRRASVSVASINAEAKLAELQQKSEEQFRAELIAQIDRLQERLEHVEKELDEWKRSYYELYQQKAELAVENATLKGEAALMQAKLDYCAANHIG